MVSWHRFNCPFSAWGNLNPRFPGEEIFASGTPLSTPVKRTFYKQVNTTISHGFEEKCNDHSVYLKEEH